jgi:hypothetical protein
MELLGNDEDDSHAAKNLVVSGLQAADAIFALENPGI